MSKWKRLQRLLFGYRCSYFDVFLVSLSVEIGGVYGYGIGLGVLFVLAAISGAMSVYAEGDRP